MNFLICSFSFFSHIDLVGCVFFQFLFYSSYKKKSCFTYISVSFHRRRLRIDGWIIIFISTFVTIIQQWSFDVQTFVIENNRSDGRGNDC